MDTSLGPRHHASLIAILVLAGGALPASGRIVAPKIPLPRCPPISGPQYNSSLYGCCLQSTGAVIYPKNAQTCCNVAGIQLLANNLGSCSSLITTCGNAGYVDPLKYQCCYGDHIQPVNTVCTKPLCGRVPFDPTTQRCCTSPTFGTVVGPKSTLPCSFSTCFGQLIDSSTTGCCGGRLPYTLSDTTCCSGINYVNGPFLFPGPSVNCSEVVKPCININRNPPIIYYNTKTDQCCVDGDVAGLNAQCRVQMCGILPYDTTSSICCAPDYTVPTNGPGCQFATCGTQKYAPSIQSCCASDNSTVVKTGYESELCPQPCGKTIFHPLTESCCSPDVIVAGNMTNCCGAEPFDTASTISKCCSGTYVYPINATCNNYPYGYTYCDLANAAYNATTNDCCEDGSIALKGACPTCSGTPILHKEIKCCNGVQYDAVGSTECCENVGTYNPVWSVCCGTYIASKNVGCGGGAPANPVIPPPANPPANPVIPPLANPPANPVPPPPNYRLGDSCLNKPLIPYPAGIGCCPLPPGSTDWRIYYPGYSTCCQQGVFYNNQVPSDCFTNGGTVPVNIGTELLPCSMFTFVFPPNCIPKSGSA